MHRPLAFSAVTGYQVAGFLVQLHYCSYFPISERVLRMEFKGIVHRSRKGKIDMNDAKRIDLSRGKARVKLSP